MRYVASLVLVLCVLVGPAFAKKARPALAIKCNELSYTAELAQCAAEDSKKLDQTMNVLLAALLKKHLHPENLNSSQKAWRAYREAECTMVMGPPPPSNGATFVIMYQDCIDEFTKARIKQFRELNRSKTIGENW